MGIRTGIIGNIRQRAGDVRFSNWKGRNVVAQMPVSYNDANTLQQRANRRKLGFLAGLAALFRIAIIQGFQQVSTSITTYNNFVKKNYASVTDNGTISSVNPALLEIADGTVLGVAGLVVTTGAAAGELDIDIAANANGTTGYDTDIAKVFVYHPATKAFIDKSGSLTRGTLAAGAVLTGLNALTGQSVHVYVFFKDMTLARFSPSSATGPIVVG